MTHTPGPWSVVKNITAPICYIQSRDGQVATTYGEQDFYNHQLPNAQLLAAAPDLLDACEAWMNWIKGGNLSHEDIIEQTDAAIAKARGRPPKKES